MSLAGKAALGAVQLQGREVFLVLSGEIILLLESWLVNTITYKNQILNPKP